MPSRLTYDKMKQQVPKKQVPKKQVPKTGAPILLDSNHTHFIFTDDGEKSNFGSETQLRADFEACVAANYPPHAVQNVCTGVKGVIRPCKWCLSVCLSRVSFVVCLSRV